MKRDSFEHVVPASTNLQLNRRLTERIPTGFSVMYSGMYSGDMVISDGTVMNLSAEGIGIRGYRLVAEGMELTLFIDLPGEEEPVCIAQSRVSWVAGRRFGVEMLGPTLKARNQLRFHMWNALSRSTDRRS